MRCVFIYKKKNTLRYVHEFFKYIQKLRHFSLRFYIQQAIHFVKRSQNICPYLKTARHFALVFNIEKAQQLQKARHFALRLYIYKSIHFVLHS